VTISVRPSSSWANSSLEQPGIPLIQGAVGILITMIKQSVCGVQRNDENGKPERVALVFIHGHSQIAKTSAEEGVRKIDQLNWVYVTARV